jgi:hypothetical protein
VVQHLREFHQWHGEDTIADRFGNHGHDLHHTAGDFSFEIRSPGSARCDRVPLYTPAPVVFRLAVAGEENSFGKRGRHLVKMNMTLGLPGKYDDTRQNVSDWRSTIR